MASTAIVITAGTVSVTAMATFAYPTTTTIAAAATVTTDRTTAATAITAAGPVQRGGIAAASAFAAVVINIAAATVAVARTAGLATTTAPATPTITTRPQRVRPKPSPPPRQLQSPKTSTTRSQRSNQQANDHLPTRGSPPASPWSHVCSPPIDFHGYQRPPRQILEHHTKPVRTMNTNHEVRGDRSDASVGKKDPRTRALNQIVDDGRNSRP